MRKQNTSASYYQDRLTSRGHDQGYNKQAARTLAAICDDWEEKWLITQKRVGSNHTILNKGMVTRCMMNMIMRHIKLQRSSGLESLTEVLKREMFHTQAPASIQRQTIMAGGQYYTFLAAILNDLEKELEHGSNYSSY